MAFNCQAQIKDGFFAPNVELTDLDGNTHNLFSILDEGKTIILDFSATWCEPCWVFHNSGLLNQLHQQYSNEIQVFMIEADPLTGINCLMNECDEVQTGNVTLGNWVENIPYPIVNDDELAALFQISFFPSLYAICPDRTVTLLNPDESPNLQDVVDVITTCGSTTGIENRLKVQAYTEKTDYVCSTVEPSFFIQNYGSNSITQATFLLTINKDTVETFNWEGNLQNTYDYEKIVFPEREITDFNRFELIIKALNGMENTDTLHPIFRQTVNKAEATLYDEIKITIHTDDFGNETYWAIVNEANEILIDGGNKKVGLDNFGSGYPEDYESAYANNDTIVENFLLPANGCYQVFITDAYGDGFCCSAGNGLFEIKDYVGNSLIKITNELQGKFEAALRLEKQAPRANFFIEQDENSIRVTNASALADEWFWVFGDNTDPVKTKNPSTHIYDENGTYEICLTVKNSYGENTTCQQVEITEAPVGIYEVDRANHIQISPNPASHQIQIKFSLPFNELVHHIQIYNVDGQLMKEVIPTSQTSSPVILINELSNGIYFITFEFKNNFITRKLIKI